MEQIKYELSSQFKKARHHLSSLDKTDQERLMGSSYIVLSLFAVAFFSIFAIYPTLGTIANLKRQYDDNIEVDQKLDQKISALSSLEQQYTELSQTSLPLIMNAIPQSPEIPSFTRKVESLAKTHGITLNFLNVGEVELFPAEKLQKGFSALEFSITAEGAKEATNAFTKDVLSFDRIITLESQSRAEGEEAEHSVSITGKIYFNK
jgi:Tfp pilus assembly protein PilO